jgi:hypothetical protein
MHAAPFFFLLLLQHESYELEGKRHTRSGIARMDRLVVVLWRVKEKF